MSTALPPYRRLVVRRFAWTALACSLLGSVAPPLSAAPQQPVLVSRSGEALLELASGETISASLPAGASLDVAAALDSGWLAAGTQPGSRDLLLLTGNSQTVSALPAPPGKTAARRQEPLPLVENGRLAGLVWLEGENRRSLGVRFAAWTGTAWDTPEVVAPPGPGSQLALTAAHLHDGTWLLAWSAFDGHDDEIVWSRRVHGAWSRPQRVAADNSVPDITPALSVAGNAGDSALLAWSRYEPALGEYRVVMSRFVQGHWTAPEAAAPPGSFYPTFEAAPSGRVRMLYRTAMPQGWEIVEMDTAGHAVRHATMITAKTAAESARPVVSTAAADTAAVFRWPAAGTQRSIAWTAEEHKP
ncbi:MAG TPA: hypothetical protein VH988_03970 [Thermoanaerobaculia bacterium]|jgi:hypothetical protein|nr:hypothetical protein [Thermoanaerobaculia bacterium]